MGAVSNSRTTEYSQTADKPKLVRRFAFSKPEVLQKTSGFFYFTKKERSKYEKIELLGKTALFSNARLMDADIPEGLYCYHLRHSDDGGKFCSVEPSVGVNHGGSVILKEPLDFGKSEYIPLDEETSPNFSGERENFSDFLSDTSPQEAEEMKLC